MNFEEAEPQILHPAHVCNVAHYPHKINVIGLNRNGQVNV